MASSLNASNSGAGGLISTADASGVLQLQTASTTAVTIDTSQNVGIGTTSPAVVLDVKSAAAKQYLTSTTGTNASYQGYFNTNGALYVGVDDSAGNSFTGSGYSNVVWSTKAYPLVFATNNAERMRIDTSGNVLVGVTSSGSYSAGSAIGTTGYMSRSGTGGSFGNNRFNIFWSGSAARLWIDNVDQGTISVSSDYRIKKDIQSQTLTAIDRINEIRPVTYTYADNKSLNWKADGVIREGFIAHEIAEVIPSAVDGEKDAENQIQSLKLDALCSVMVKAIQEQQTIINDLKARVTALEGASL